MPHPFDLLPLPKGGGLIFTPCPGTKDVELEQALQDLRAAGASAVITLMPEAELAANQVSHLADACAKLGLAWFHFPVEDEAAPGELFAAQWAKHGAHVLQLLDQGHILAVHCKGGSGRTGLMIGKLLVARGMSPAEAIQTVKMLRPRAFSQAVHVDYLHAQAA